MGCWQWFTLITGIIGVVAFLMAIPALYHIWGKPKLRITFDCAKGYRLTCWIRNMPINRVLASLNEVRTQVAISPIITITDKKGRVLQLLHYPQTQSDDIRLVVAEVTEPSKGMVYMKNVTGNTTREKLDAGSYSLNVELWASDGRLLKKKKTQLHINKSQPFIGVH